MIDLHRTRVDDRLVRVIASERSDGDMNPRRVPAPELAVRQRALTGTTWSMLDQIHGTGVVVDPPACGELHVGDIAVSSPGGRPVAVWAADCAPIVLIGADATAVVVHAGWRGIAAGVVDGGVDEAVRRSGRVVAAVLGPVIHPCCYEFDPPDIRAVETAVGAPRSSLAGTSGTGRPALDVPSAVTAALARRGIDLDVIGPCTGCDLRWYSHRRRGELERHAVVVWSERS